MGIVVAVLMGIVCTLPVNPAAFASMLNLSGIAAGAAAIGCSAQMVGFAAAGLRENGIEGFWPRESEHPCFSFRIFFEDPGYGFHRLYPVEF